MRTLRHAAGITAPLLLLVAGCEGEVTTSRKDLAPADARIIWTEAGPIKVDRGPADALVNRDGPGAVDATTQAGQPCTYGKCASNLICMANVCHTICSGECGDKAPECTGTEGCHWVTSFAAACMPGTAAYLQKCGDGVWCVGGNLCVNVSGSGTKCLRLCKYGCPTGSYCGSTSNGCKVCIQ